MEVGGIMGSVRKMGVGSGERMERWRSIEGASGVDKGVNKYR